MGGGGVIFELHSSGGLISKQSTPVRCVLKSGSVLQEKLESYDQTLLPLEVK